GPPECGPPRRIGLHLRLAGRGAGTGGCLRRAAAVPVAGAAGGARRGGHLRRLRHPAGRGPGLRDRPAGVRGGRWPHPRDPPARPDPAVPGRRRQLADLQLDHRRDPGATVGRRAPAGRPAGARGRRLLRPLPGRHGGGLMNKQLRHVWVVVSVLFVLLFPSATYHHLVPQERLNSDGRNRRTIYTGSGRHRGRLVVDGSPIAASVGSDDTYAYLRTYDPGSICAPGTGYYSVVYGFAGIERSLNDTLSGEADALFYHRISDILSGRQGRGATVELTLDSEAQEAAWDALDGRRGAAVALDPETGAVLAM